jgi:hypothetical protein
VNGAVLEACAGDTTLSERAHSLLAATLTNSAQFYVRLKQLEDARRVCTLAVEAAFLQPAARAKALYWRAQAWMAEATNDGDQAAACDANAAAALQPHDPGCARLAQLAASRAAASLREERRASVAMVGKRRGSGQQSTKAIRLQRCVYALAGAHLLWRLHKLRLLEWLVSAIFTRGT